MAFLKFWTSPYELIPVEKKKASARHGALLKFEFSNESFGYADLHPWPEFGDLPLAAHLESLKTSSPTELARIALENASVDAQARKKQASLLAGVGKVRNNAIITDLQKPNTLENVQELEKLGYESLKLKMGSNLAAEIPILKKILARTNLQIRLDANSKLSYQQASDFLKLLTVYEKGKIEYFEDPCPFDKKFWNNLRSYLPIALDWESARALDAGLPKAWDVIVIKPARQNLNFWLQVAQKNESMITITSMMDHPLGVLQALIKAVEVKNKWPEKSLIAGCQTVHLYESTNFSHFLKQSGPFLQPVDSKDLGLGFSAALESVPWK